jgi:hypothetical protein
MGRVEPSERCPSLPPTTTDSEGRERGDDLVEDSRPGHDVCRGGGV